MTMTVKTKVVSLVEQALKRHFHMLGTQVGPGWTEMDQQEPQEKI